MRKILVGALVGLTLIGSQAIAAGAAQPLAVGDRVGAVVGASSRNFQQGPTFDFPTIAWVTGVTIIGAVTIYAFNDNDDSASN